MLTHASDDYDVTNVAIASELEDSFSGGNCAFHLRQKDLATRNLLRDFALRLQGVMKLVLDTS